MSRQSKTAFETHKYRTNETYRERCKLYQRRYRALHKSRLRTVSRAQHLFRKYGITLEQYAVIKKQQDNKCAVCLKEQTPTSTHPDLSVDHCHKTGKVRGLLCDGCNKALGILDDSIETLTNAILYLRDSNVR